VSRGARRTAAPLSRQPRASDEGWRLTSPGIPEWEAEGIPEADTEPADAGVDHLAGPDDVEAASPDAAAEDRADVAGPDGGGA
jgi:hypothetical protein